MPEIASINGRIVPPASATISVDDWAVRYGWGLFETIRLMEGCPLFLDRHLERMCSAAPLLELTANPIRDGLRWRKEISQALAESRMRDGAINCYWTLGSGLSSRTRTRIIRIRRIPDYVGRPLRLWLAPWRIEPTYPGSGIKSLAYFPHIFASVCAHREGCEEALILNTSECVADGAASSIFVVKNGTLFTPSLDQGTLVGITRAVTLEIAKSLHIPIRETRVSWKTLLAADDLFLASSLRGLRQVREIPGHWKSKSVDKLTFKRLKPAWEEAVVDHVSLWKTSGYRHPLR